MVVLAIAVAAALIWGAFLLFSYRQFRFISTQQRENALGFRMQAAPWSDRHVESLLADNPRSPVLLSQHVVNAIERKDWPEADRRSERFVARAPRRAQAWLLRVRALRGGGREAEAETLLRRALRRMPREFEVALTWARWAADHQDWPEAARRFAAFRRRFPRRAEGYTEAFEVLMRLDGRQEDAAAVIADGMQRLPDTWTLWRSAAALAERRGEPAEALRLWQDARARFPTEPAVYLGEAAALHRAGQAEAALALVAQARDFFPSNTTVAAELARLRGDPPSA